MCMCVSLPTLWLKDTLSGPLTVNFTYVISKGVPRIVLSTLFFMILNPGRFILFSDIE